MAITINFAKELHISPNSKLYFLWQEKKEENKMFAYLKSFLIRKFIYFNYWSLK